MTIQRQFLRGLMTLVCLEIKTKEENGLFMGTNKELDKSTVEV